MTRLFRVLVPVSDIDAAQQFYEAVLGCSGQRVSPGRHYFDCEGTILACFDPQSDGDAYDARPNPEPLYLSDLVVDSCDHGSGVGRRLLREAESHTRQAGAKYIRLSVEAGDTAALNPYAKEGFSESDLYLEKTLIPSK